MIQMSCIYNDVDSVYMGYEENGDFYGASTCDRVEIRDVATAEKYVSYGISDQLTRNASHVIGTSVGLYDSRCAWHGMLGCVQLRK